MGRTRASRVGYVIVLMGCALFVLGTILSTYHGAELKAVGEWMVDVRFGSLLRQVLHPTWEDPSLVVLLGLVSLYAGPIVVASLAIMGIVKKPAPQWMPVGLILAAALWGLGLANEIIFDATKTSAGWSLGPGSWLVLAGVMVVLGGAITVLISRRGSSVLDDPEREGRTVVSGTTGSVGGHRSPRAGYALLLAGCIVFVLGTILPTYRVLGDAPFVFWPGHDPFFHSLINRALQPPYAFTHRSAVIIVGVLALFLGPVVLGTLAIIGLRAGTPPRWLPFGIVVAALTWGLFWIGTIARYGTERTTAFVLAIGYWFVVGGLALILIGAFAVCVCVRSPRSNDPVLEAVHV